MTSSAGPIKPLDRIESIDAIRGVAVMGILLMNIRTFALPISAYWNPTIHGGEEAIDRVVFYAVQLAADMKFMAIFSMLFGAGLVMYCRRLQARGIKPAGMWYRRLCWLLVIGIAHAWLLWYGDILVAYALCGMLIYPIWRWKPMWQLLLGVILLLIGGLIWAGMGIGLSHAPPEITAKVLSEFQPDAKALQAEMLVHQGSWLTQTPWRMAAAIEMQTFIFAVWSLWRAGGLMLIGMALGAWGVFDAKRLSLGRLTIAMSLGVLGALFVMHGLDAFEADQWSGVDSVFANSLWNYYGSIGVALAWVALIMLVCRTSILAGVSNVLASVGRMALTNYLAQSLCCALIFFGWGAGWHGHLGYADQLWVVLGIWVAMMVWSPLWLARCRFGPVEWCWRSLTWWCPQPWRRQVHSSS